MVVDALVSYEALFVVYFISTYTQTIQMKIKKGFNLRNICGEYIIVAEGIVHPLIVNGFSRLQPDGIIFTVHNGQIGIYDRVIRITYK